VLPAAIALGAFTVGVAGANVLWAVLAAFAVGAVTLHGMSPTHDPPTAADQQLSWLRVALAALPAVVVVAAVTAAALVPGAFGAVTVDMAKIGSVAFGNGPVILPILQQDSLAHHWLTLNQFGAGIAFGQATPGPFLATRRSSGSQRLAGGAAWPPGWPSSRPAWR